MANAMRKSPEECQSEQPAWLPILISNCKVDLEEVYGHERERQQTKKQLLIQSPEERQSE